MAKEGRKNELNVLGFGDSFTEGFCRVGGVDGTSKSYFPYSDHLKDLLSGHFPNVTFKVVNEGHSGERVHGSMPDRLRELIKSSSVQYHIIIINGGSNDLGDRREVDIIARDLFGMHEERHRERIPTVVFTVPESKLTAENPDIARSLKMLNDQLRQRAATWSGAGMAVVADVSQEMPYGSMDSKGTKYHDHDGYHFSKVGYCHVAEIIFHTMKPLLQQHYTWLEANSSN